MPEEMPLNPNEPNPGFMLYKEEARKILLKTIGGKSNAFWLSGKTGIGKTTFMLWMREFAHYYKVFSLYFHGGDDLKFEEFKETIEKSIKASFFSRIFLRKDYVERPVLVMIDDVDFIRDENIVKYVVSKLDDSNLHLSVVMASVESIENFKEYLRGRDVEKIQLAMPSIDTVMEMVRKRIEAGGGEDYSPYGKQLVRDIIETSTTLREVLIKLKEAL
jgi:hypothetical protein